MTYPERWIPLEHANGTLPRVLQWANSDRPGRINGTTVLLADQALTSVAFPFFFGNGSQVDFGAYCPTGNCTWAPYESLAMCTETRDVSELLTYACLSAPADWLGNTTNVPTNASEYPNVRACGWYLNATSSQPYLMNGYVDTIEGPGDTLSLRMLPLIDNTSRKPRYGTGSIHFKEIQNPIADFLVVSTTGGAKKVYQNATPNAYEINVHWCTKTFEPTYRSGQLNENASNAYQNTGAPSYPWTFVKTSKNATVASYQTGIRINPPNQHPVDANTTYGLTNITHLQSIFVFDILLPSYLTSMPNQTDTPVYRYLNFPGDSSEQRVMSVNNPWSRPAGIPQHMDAMMTALSHAIRINSNQTEIITGAALIPETFVQVRWFWILLPVVLLMFTLVFIVATTVKSSSEQHEVGIWKTSALAVLLNGLDEPIQRHMGPLRSMRDVHEAAARLKIKIVPD